MSPIPSYDYLSLSYYLGKLKIELEYTSVFFWTGGQIYMWIHQIIPVGEFCGDAKPSVPSWLEEVAAMLDGGFKPLELGSGQTMSNV